MIEQDPEINVPNKPKQHATFLCLCVMDYSTRHRLMSLELSNLFSKDYHDCPLSVFDHTVITYTNDLNRSGMGMVIATDGCLYVAVCPQKMLKFYLDDTSAFAFGLEPDYLPDMNSPKFNPIVLEIKQCIYVLSTPNYSHNSKRDPDAFEVYDVSKGSWRTLEPPPCNFETYIVFDKYVCVSTRTSSYAFNTESEEWGACHLFPASIGNDNDNDSPVCEPFDDIRFFKPDGYEVPCQGGPPFPIDETGFIYEDYLLFSLQDFTSCAVQTRGTSCAVQAFKIIDGKVVEPAILLLECTMPNDNKGDCFSLLVDLGGAEFCLICSDDDLIDFTKFKVAKSDDGGLTCAKDDVKVSKVKRGEYGDEFMSSYQAEAF